MYFLLKKLLPLAAACLKPERKEALCLILIVMVPKEAVIMESNFAFRSPATNWFPTGSPWLSCRGGGPAFGLVLLVKMPPG